MGDGSGVKGWVGGEEGRFKKNCQRWAVYWATQQPGKTYFYCMRVGHLSLCPQVLRPPPAMLHTTSSPRLRREGRGGGGGASHTQVRNQVELLRDRLPALPPRARGGQGRVGARQGALGPLDVERRHRRGRERLRGRRGRDGAGVRGGVQVH